MKIYKLLLLHCVVISALGGCDSSCRDDNCLLEDDSTQCTTCFDPAHYIVVSDSANAYGSCSLYCNQKMFWNYTEEIKYCAPSLSNYKIFLRNIFLQVLVVLLISLIGSKQNYMNMHWKAMEMDALLVMKKEKRLIINQYIKLEEQIFIFAQIGELMPPIIFNSLISSFFCLFSISEYN